MSKAARKVIISLNQSLVDFPLEDAIALATSMTLEEATAMVNDRLLAEPAVRTMSRSERDEFARQVIHTELVSRYEVESARRSGSIH